MIELTETEITKQIEEDYAQATNQLAELEVALLNEGVSGLCLLAAYTFATEILLRAAKERGISQERIDLYIGLGVARAETVMKL